MPAKSDEAQEKKCKQDRENETAKKAVLTTHDSQLTAHVAQLTAYESQLLLTVH